MKLKSINFNTKYARKKLCFIFVINDKMISNFDYYKYIDYGLTIVPELGSVNAIDTMTDLLGSLKVHYDEKFITDLVQLAKENPQLCDYRTLNQIKNEFNVFREILIDRIGILKNLDEHYNETQLLIFVIYKNLLPEDYNRIRKNDSVLFHSSKNYDKANKSYESLLSFSEKGYLNETACLTFMGFSEIEKINACKNILLKAGVRRKRKFMIDDLRGEKICCKIYKEEKNEESRKDYFLYVEDIYLWYLLSEYCRYSIDSSYGKKYKKYIKNQIFEFLGLVSKYYLDNKEADVFLVNFLNESRSKIPEDLLSVVIKYFIIKRYKNYSWIDNKNLLNIFEEICKEDQNLVEFFISTNGVDIFETREFKRNRINYKYLHKLINNINETNQKNST